MITRQWQEFNKGDDEERARGVKKIFKDKADHFSIKWKKSVRRRRKRGISAPPPICGNYLVKNTSIRASVEQKHMRSVGVDFGLVLDKIEKEEFL